MKYKRLQNADTVHIKKVLTGIIRNCRKESNTVLSDIRKVWNRKLDKAVTDHAQPTALKDHTLLITVKSSTLAHQLRFLTQDILKMINADIRNYQISELKIKTGNY